MGLRLVILGKARVARVLLDSQTLDERDMAVCFLRDALHNTGWKPDSKF